MNKPREILDYRWMTLCDRKSMAEGLASMEKAGWEAIGPVFKCKGHYAQPFVRTRLVFSTRDAQPTDQKP